MGIHMTSEGNIYYRLYNTKVAIFYKPLPDGTRYVETNYYSSQTTNIFMWDNDLNYYELATTEGKQVKVPYVPTWDSSQKQHTPSATLWFDKEGKLILGKSWHKDIYTYKSSAEDKQKRKEFKKKLDTLMTLSMFRLPEYRANAKLDSDLGQPFGTGYRNAPIEIRRFEEVARDVGAEQTDHPEYIEKFLDLGQAVFNILASKRAFESSLEGEYGYNNLFHRYNNTPEQIASKEAKLQEIVEEVTAEEFKKSMTTRLLGVASLKTGSVKTPWGQFPDSLPRKSFI
jgi:hypothetical protein